MHAVAIVIGAVLMAIGGGHLIASSLQLLELQCEVNERLPESDKFEPVFWSLPQLMQLRRLQRSSLPQSPRIGKAVRFAVIGFAVIISGVSLLLFGLSSIYKP